MSSPSIKYDPTASTPGYYPDDKDVSTTIQALAANLIPESLLKYSSNKSHRDAVIASGMTSLSDHGIKSIVDTLSAKLRSMADNSSDEVRIYCELLAAFSYASGDVETAKLAMLRLDPSKATGLLKTVYSAMIERGIQPGAFKTMLEVNASTALNDWAQQV